MNLNWTRRVLAMVLCLCMLFGSSVLAEETVEAIVEATAETAEAPAVVVLEEEEVAEEVDVAVDEAAEEPSEEPVPVVVTPLAAAEVIPQEGWEMGENNAYTIPYAAGTEEVTFTWAAIEGAASYRIETAHISESGEPEGIQEIGVVEDASIALPVSAYSNGWYALGIVAEAEDGRSSVCMQVFRLQEEVSEEEEEVAENADVSVEATTLQIIIPPQSVTVAEGELATVSVQAIGDGLNYTWYIKDANATSYSKSSITTNTYSVAMNASRDGRRLICYVGDQYGNRIQCDTVVIKMATSQNPLRIVQQPQSVTVANGAKATVTVKATGDGLSYVWYAKEAGADSYYKSTITTASYSVIMNESRNGRRLICYVSDKYGNKIQCNTVVIKMSSPLTIVTQPKSVTVNEGQTATVTVKATGDGLTYEWYAKEAGASSYYKSTITTASYSVAMNASRSGRRLICYVSDKYGNKVQCDTAMIKMLSATKPSLSAVRVGEGSISLSWSQIENAQGYYLYRSLDLGETWTKCGIFNSGSTTSYTNNNLSSGYYLYYKVQAFANGGKALGTMSNEPGVFTSAKVNPVISSITVSGSSPNATATVKWKELPGIQYYRVMRSTSSDFTTDYEGVTVYPGSSTYRTYTDTGLEGGTYYYRMDAYYESVNGYVLGFTTGYSSTYTITVPGGSSTSGGDGVVTYRAFLVGNLYPGTVNELPGPDNDISAMARMLSRQTASDYDIWTGKNLYASTILSGITQVLGDADEDDVSLFYYSGHGTSTGSLVGVDGYYVTVNSLRNKLDTIKGKKIVLLDSCYSGAHINKTYGDGDIDYSAFNDAIVSKFAAKDKTLCTNDYVVITACSKTQTSSSLGFYDSSSGGYFYFGGFTYGVTKGSGFEMIDWTTCSRYADTNYNGKLTLAEVYNYAYSQAKNYLGLSQNAQYYGDTSFVLWKY